MSATDDDTELRDLLIQNLENNGVLNKLKAEMRAAVFLALEEQDRLERKTPLVNENLKNCLNTKDGRLVASLIVDFMRVFHLDFSLAVFQPEINTQLSLLDSRELLCDELELSEAELNANTPLLLELVRRGRRKATSAERASEESRVTADKDSVAAILSSHEKLVQQASVPEKESELELFGDLEQQDDEDSFFDDPLPRPQKTCGSRSAAPDSRQSPAVSLSEAPPTSMGDQAAGGEGGRSASEKSHSHTEDDNDYADDFNSHRSDLYKSDVSEDIYEVSIEGPDHSDKLEETVDVSVSQPSVSVGADYMEEVA